MNGQDFGFKFISPTAINSGTILWVLLTIVLVVFTFTYGTYLLKRWRKMQAFRQEMSALGLDSEQEGTLASMVKRYRMEKPVTLLLSERLFDEMATREMLRTLGSKAPQETKEKYILELYEIRERTYGHEYRDKAAACEVG